MAKFSRRVAFTLLVLGVGLPSWGAAPPFDAMIASVPESIASYGSQSPRASLKTAEKGKEIFTANLKAYLVSATLVNSIEIRRRSEEQNIILSLSNLRSLAQQVASDYRTFENKKGADQVIEILSDKNSPSEKLIRSLIESDASFQIINSFAIGSVKSVNARYTNELIRATARFVLDHPQTWGGLNDEQVNSTKILLSSSGTSCFFKGLVTGGPQTQRAFLNVFLQLQQTIYEDGTLREVLWSEMLREAGLKDTNLAVKTVSAVSDIDDRGYLWNHISTELYLLRVTAGQMAVSGSFALGVGEFLPHWLGDTEAIAVQLGQNAVNIYASETKSEKFRQDIVNKDASLSVSQVQKYLNEVRDVRQIQMTGYFSIMKLTLDRLDDASTVAHLRTYYQQVLNHSFANTKKVYVVAQQELTTFAAEAQGPAKDMLLKEIDRMKFLSEFVDYFIEILDAPQNFSASKYWATRDALDQISFWGFREFEFITK